MSEEEVKIIEADYSLKKKAGNVDISKYISPEKVRQAEEVVETKKAQMQEDIYNDILELEKAFIKLPEVADVKPSLLFITDTALNVKSNAAMANYILATEFAKSLYQFCMNLSDLDDNDAKIVKAHIDALKNIFKYKKTDTGDQTDRELLKALMQYAKNKNSPEFP